MKKLTKAIASSLIVASVIALNPIGASASWKQDSHGWWHSEGSSWSKGWKNIDGKWYYFGQDGYMLHNTMIDGYYLDSNGVWAGAANGSLYESTVANAQNINMYSEPATGEMAGWQILRGHPYEDVAEIYYKFEGNIQSVKLKDIREFDLNKIVVWTDDYGIKRYNTLKDVYSLFQLSNEYTDDWFSNKFGSVYDDWLMLGNIKAEYIVSDYLKKTGQIKNQYHVTLTPDAKIETTDADTDEEDISGKDIIKNIEKSMKKDSKYYVAD